MVFKTFSKLFEGEEDQPDRPLPQCWKDCLNEAYKEEINRERKILIQVCIDAAFAFQYLQLKIQDGRGTIQDVDQQFQKCTDHLAEAMGKFTSLLSMKCDKCKFRNFDL